MPHDPVRIAETKSWLLKAARDLRAADHEWSANPPHRDDIAFHCQQAVEKSLKAFLTWHDIAFRKTHDLVELGRACVGVRADVSSLLQRAAPLTEYAWKFRYPEKRTSHHPRKPMKPFLWRVRSTKRCSSCSLKNRTLELQSC